MPSNIVLPNLIQWTEEHISAIIKATSPSGFNDALDAFLAKDVVITVNGSIVSRADFAKQAQAEKFDEEGATVTFAGAVSAPADKKNPEEAGSVGVFYTAIIQEAIRVRDAPVSSNITASVNVVIEQDLSLPPPPPPPIRGDSDRRRVKVLNQVFSDARVPFGV